MSIQSLLSMCRDCRLKCGGVIEYCITMLDSGIWFPFLEVTRAMKRYSRVPDSLRKTLPHGDLCLPTFHKHSKERKLSGPQNSSEVLKRVRRTGCNLQHLYFYAKHTYILRACLHRVGGPQVREVTRLGGVTRLSI